MNQESLTRTFHGATLTVPVEELFKAWLRQFTEEMKHAFGEVPLIGQPWRGQGGINGGLARDEHGKPYWLIVAPANIGSFESLAYGGYREDEPNAMSEFDGLANTIALCESKIDHPAAQRCRELNHDGHQDFYLFAKREGAMLYANVREEFESGWYITSTQYSARNAWYQDFYGGYQNGTTKYYEGQVRAVRRLKI